jgi:hypothetical protein
MQLVPTAVVPTCLLGQVLLVSTQPLVVTSVVGTGCIPKQTNPVGHRK